MGRARSTSPVTTWPSAPGSPNDRAMTPSREEREGHCVRKPDGRVREVVEGQDQRAAGTQHPLALAEAGDQVGEVVEAVERRRGDDQVEVLVRAGQAPTSALAPRRPGWRASAASIQVNPVDLDASRPSGAANPWPTDSSKRSVFRTRVGRRRPLAAVACVQLELRGGDSGEADPPQHLESPRAGRGDARQSRPLLGRRGPAAGLAQLRTVNTRQAHRVRNQRDRSPELGPEARTASLRSPANRGVDSGLTTTGSGGRAGLRSGAGSQSGSVVPSRSGKRGSPSSGSGSSGEA